MTPLDRLDGLLAATRERNPSEYVTGYIEALEVAIAILGGDAWPPCGDCGHDRLDHKDDRPCSSPDGFAGPCGCLAYHPRHHHEAQSPIDVDLLTQVLAMHDDALLWGTLESAREVAEYMAAEYVKIAEARGAGRMTSLYVLHGSTSRARANGYTTSTEGDSVNALESRRLGARDHPPAPGLSRSSRVIR